MKAAHSYPNPAHGPGIERLLAEMELTSLHQHSCCQSSPMRLLILSTLRLVIELIKGRLWRRDERKQEPVWSDPGSRGFNPFSLCPQKSGRFALAISRAMSYGEISGDLSLLSRPGGVKLSRLPHMQVLNYIVLSLFTLCDQGPDKFYNALESSPNLNQ
jgi:hypothetical protein